MPSTFDQAAWHVNHTRLVNRVLDRFEGEGRSVSVEAQNQFTLVGRVATVGGKPDIIAVSGDSVTVCDAKTGQPRISDQVQVMVTRSVQSEGRVDRMVPREPIRVTRK